MVKEHEKQKQKTNSSLVHPFDMEPTSSRVVYSNSRSSRSQDKRICYSPDRIKYEEDREKRRREWRREQEMLKEHNIHKQKMIEKYEAERARKLKLNLTKQGSCSRSYNEERSRSRSLEMLSKIKSGSSSSKALVMSEKTQSSNGSAPLFKGPEGIQIGIAELRRIQVDIRNIPSTVTTTELQRDIVNPDEIMLARREGQQEQEMLKEHNKYKQKMIEKYEAERACKLKLNLAKQGSYSYSYDEERSRSRSSEMLSKIKSGSSSSKALVISEKTQSSDESAPLFKSPEGIQICIAELRRIQVDIRNIPSTVTTNELDAIVNPDEVMLSRREGVVVDRIGSQENSSQTEKGTSEVEERRTIRLVDTRREAKRTQSSRHSPSLTLSRNRSRSPRRLSPHHSRERDHIRERSKKSRDRSKDKDAKVNRPSRDNWTAHSSKSQDRMFSREQSKRISDRCSRFRPTREDSSYRSNRENSRENTREDRDKDNTRTRSGRPTDRNREVEVQRHHSSREDRTAHQSRSRDRSSTREHWDQTSDHHFRSARLSNLDQRNTEHWLRYQHEAKMRGAFIQSRGPRFPHHLDPVQVVYYENPVMVVPIPPPMALPIPPSRHQPFWRPPRGPIIGQMRMPYRPRYPPPNAYTSDRFGHHFK